MYPIPNLICPGCGNQQIYCKCGDTGITMTDDYLAENYVRKKVLRELVERWRKEQAFLWDEEGGGVYKDCADELEKLLS